MWIFIVLLAFRLIINVYFNRHDKWIREDIIINKRIEYIDIFRGIGIIFMIMGHIGFGEGFDHFIHAFHMPMFFFISGFLYKKTSLSFRKFCAKKFNSLLIPYFSFGIIYYLIWLGLFRNGNYLAPLEHLFFINTDGLPIAGALWFLTALFLTDILVYILEKKVSDIWLQVLIVSIFSLIGCLETTIFPHRLPFALGASFVGLGLFYLGRLFRLNNYFIKECLNLNWIQLILLIPITIFLIFSNGYINMRMGVYSNILLFWINSLLSCLILINISKLILRGKELNILYNYILNLDISIGKNSISYVCLNQFVILVLVKATNLVFNSRALPILLFKKIFILILCIYIIFIFDYIIRKTPLKRLIGVKS